VRSVFKVISILGYSSCKETEIFNVEGKMGPNSFVMKISSISYFPSIILLEFINKVCV
jgi:hypothetical protein